MALSDSPLVVLAFILLFPFVAQQLLPTLKSPASLRSCLRPKISARRPLHTSPSEFLLLVLCFVLVACNSYYCNPRNSDARAAKDVFRHTRLNIGASSVQLRSRLADFTPEQLGIGHFSSDDTPESGDAGVEISDVIESLLRRLGNMAGRQLYLLLGPVPLLECHFCKQASDLRLYAVPSLLLTYAMHGILFGILTINGSAMTAIDHMLVSVWPWSLANSLRNNQSSPSATIPRERVSSAYLRRPVYLTLIAAFFAETSMVLDWISWPWSPDPTSKWNHPHHNMFLARHIGFAAISALLYLYPARPTPTIDATSSATREIVRTTIQLGALLSGLHRNVGSTTSNLTLLHAGRQAIWRDLGLREAVAKWYDEHHAGSRLLVDNEVTGGRGELTTDSSEDDVAADASRIFEEAQKRGWLQPGAKAAVKEEIRSTLADARRRDALVRTDRAKSMLARGNDVEKKSTVESGDSTKPASEAATASASASQDDTLIKYPVESVSTAADPKKSTMPA